MIILSRNATYPFPVRALEGASAQFLAKSGNILQIAMPNIQRSEERLVRKGPMKAGFIHDGPLLVWVFTFGDLIFDCPFDARLIPPAELNLPSVENDRQRLGIEVNLIDTATSRIRGLRYSTLTPQLTRAFLSAVQDQLADPRDLSPYLAKHHRIPILALPKLCRLELCGRDDATDHSAMDRRKSSRRRPHH